MFFKPYLAAIGKKKVDEVTQAEVDALHLEVMPFVLASHFFWGTWAILQVCLVIRTGLLTPLAIAGTLFADRL